jgi:putative ABC transport system substrate-binding protein
MAMRRREFIVALGGAAAWPVVARAQQPMPVIGYLSGGSPGPFAPYLAAFRQGLSKSGYAEGQNVSIEYRWAEGEYDQLPRLASELVGRKVDVIAASGGDLAARAAKGATSFFVVELHAKRFELITELVPKAKIIALLVNPNSPQTERVLEAMRQTTRTKGVQLEVLKAATDIEIDTAFAALDQLHADLLIEQSDPFFVNRRQQFALLAARHAIPTVYEQRVFAQAGGLISYGPDILDVYRQIGAYVGRILKGEKCADLPVVQPTKLELVVNLMAAKAIGLTIPESFLLRADEVID